MPPQRSVSYPMQTYIKLNVLDNVAIVVQPMP